MMLSALTFHGVSKVMICVPAPEATEEQSCQGNIRKSMLLLLVRADEWSANKPLLAVITWFSSTPVPFAMSVMQTI